MGPWRAAHARATRSLFQAVLLVNRRAKCLNRCLRAAGLNCRQHQGGPLATCGLPLEVMFLTVCTGIRACPVASLYRARRRLRGYAITLVSTTADGCCLARRWPTWSMHACTRLRNSMQTAGGVVICVSGPGTAGRPLRAGFLPRKHLRLRSPHLSAEPCH